MRIVHNGGFLIDMDGVVCTGGVALPGVQKFISGLIEQNRPFLLLTNNSEPTPATIRNRLLQSGLDIPIECIYTSAMATVAWAQANNMGENVMVLGEAGLLEALVEAGYRPTKKNPDWIVLGEVRRLDYDELCLAVNLIRQGVPLVATNPDTVIPNGREMIIGCGAVAAMLEKATGADVIMVGKPQPSMFQAAMSHLNLSPNQLIMIGDMMETDIAGRPADAGLRSILVLSGVTKAEQVAAYPYKPTYIAAGLGDIEVG